MGGVGSVYDLVLYLYLGFRVGLTHGIAIANLPGLANAKDLTLRTRILLAGQAEMLAGLQFGELR